MIRLFKPNDWYPVWSQACTWTIEDEFFGDGQEKCYYEILYSPFRKIFKLKIRGYKPKKHGYYHVAVQKLNEFINGRTNNQA
jgi:hypothetical protein